VQQQQKSLLAAAEATVVVQYKYNKNICIAHNGWL